VVIIFVPLAGGPAGRCAFEDEIVLLHRATLRGAFLNPVALPPGRARLSTMPAPTGSTAAENTIGTVRVPCNNCATCAAPVVQTTPGESAPNSAAYLRRSAVPALRR